MLTRSLLLRPGHHRSIDNVPRQPSGLTLVCVPLVQESEGEDLEQDQEEEDGEHAEDDTETFLIVRLVLGFEEERSDDVSGGGTNVVDGHDDGFLGGSSSVGDGPRYDQGVTSEDESLRCARMINFAF